ncbi:hypothetical protein [Streptomyces sp. NPDC048623]|uniref:hypothetical protein n=1 Tax=Streptomyces sp. NPDC048623 TaxID=3155761 RepID=UPI003422555C
MTLTTGRAQQDPGEGARPAAAISHATVVRPPDPDPLGPDPDLDPRGPRSRGGSRPARPAGNGSEGSEGSEEPFPRRAVHRAGVRVRGRIRALAATVPARLRLARTATLVLLAALAVLLLRSGLAADGAWDTAEQAHAPSITSAAGVDLALNDMDAQAANILLSSGEAGRGRLDEAYTKATGFYDDARRTVSHELRVLAVAAEGDPAAEETVDRLTENFAIYQERIGRALENDARPGGKADARSDYQSANQLLGDELLPEAEALVRTNDTTYLADYTDARDALDAEELTLLALGGLLLLLLGALQWFLAVRFRRILNPGLVAATLCAVTALVLAGQALSGTAEQMRVARHDSYDSVVALSKARALSYQANADESHFLLFPSLRSSYESTYLERSQKLYGVQGATLDTYADRLDVTWAAYRGDHSVLRFTGEFRRELDNITFPGEREAAERTIDAYAVYQHDDRTFRDLVGQGKEREAVVFCLGWQPDQSNAHFGVWMTELQKLTDLNRSSFTSSAAEGRADLAGLLPAAGAALLLAALLTVLGLRPRLAEYR